MSYLRSFYPQTNQIEALLSYKHSPSGNASFGLSGNSVLSFNISGDILKVNNVFFSSLDEDNLITVEIAGSNNNVTVWKDGSPVINPFTTGFSFNSVFCSLPSGSTFNEKVFGTKPSIRHNLSSWNEPLKSGNLVIFNSGSHPLQITGLYLKNSHATPVFTPISVAASSSGTIPIIYDSECPFSGIGTFTLETNAGEYVFTEDFYMNFPRNYNSFSASFESDINFPTGLSNFFLKNEGTQDLEVELFFNLNSFQPLQAKLGSATYSDPSGLQFVNYSNSGYFKKVKGVGGFNISINEVINGCKSFPVQYTGNFTGIGGRLGATGVQSGSGSSNFGVYPQGQIIYNYNIPVSSYVLGQFARSTANGLLTGNVGEGSGSFHFFQNITTTVNSAYLSDGTLIYPSITDIFSGKVNTNVALSTGVSGVKTYYVFEDVYVYEGKGDFKEFWAIDYNDVDRGLENFGTLGRVTSSGFGVSGIKYRVPAKSTTSGQVRYVSNYSDPIFQEFIFRVTDNTSLNETLYINSKGNRP
jgi:hypothetical protein